ncbi:colony stimulating factor 3 (granulocyte) a [Gymnodraco acuticeps]|uniref:Colony stimulating factor 3 (Granulocyte) a n=1 Tax=Gymnodraco acuticeps TaxID=8218 RepID=A0A6P8U1I3_GYMAC|nr:colony stimulating factor 3 (granulocyte) a [Gymnodraco acuticeps]XP_034070580.1 colony stimulating factor 3 (granulocyte) a [Gymnodraco acuticeps]XP_034070581.1 colony stimulating factor 3 (granulocyte) a [Gymnodraco acuticeps]
MATLARSAPLQPEMGALVEGTQFQEIVLRSRSLIEKILLSIPDTHKECIHIETLKLNSSENANFVTMASTIGIPAAPVLKVVSENFSLETGLRRMSEGLQLHRALLRSVSPRLEQKDRVIGLQADIRDLVVQINKMLKMTHAEAVVQPSPTPVALRLPGEYEVQVAAHLTLVQLQAFGQDTTRCLRGLDRSNDEEMQS